MGIFKDDERVAGLSTEPGASVADQINNEGGEKTVTDEQTQSAIQAEVDPSAADLLDPQEVVPEPKQVEPAQVIYVPHKDFEARVNDQIFHFRQDVPTRVTRDVANMLLEDRERGYLKQ